MTMLDFTEKSSGLRAAAAAGNAFWNAVARECPGVWIECVGSEGSAGSHYSVTNLVVPLPELGAWLRAPVLYRSLAGRHLFGSNVTLARSEHGAGKTVDLLTAAAHIIAEPSLVGEVSDQKRELFRHRLRDSLTSLSHGLATRARSRDEHQDGDLNFLASEQALALGHPLHPTAKSRDQFSVADNYRYSPEFGRAFGLAWFSVEPALVETGAVPSLRATECARQLIHLDPTLPPGTAARLSENGKRVLLPAHPWQATQIINHPVVRAYEETGKLRYLGELGQAWYATSSLRSLYAGHSRWMVKCSLALRLTNAIRTLAPDEPARGRDLHLLMSSYVGTALRAAYPDFHVLTEPAHLALRDHAGVPMHEACVIFRNNPFLDRRGANVFMLATLCEDGPQFGSSRLSRLIVRLTERHRASPAETAKTWFANFIRVAIEPVLMARSNFGLLFGAHQQNLLLRLLDGWPNASYYRDAFGTCFVDEMYEQLSPAVSGECLSGHGRVPREIGDRSFTHNLMVNNVLNVIATLGHSGLVTESDLLQVLKRRLWRMHQRSLLDSSFMEHLLNHPTIPAKANFLTVLHDVDENRSASERTGLEALYVDLPNPLKLETAL